MRYPLLLSCVILLAASSTGLAAAEHDRFPKAVKVADRELTLNGKGLCEWGFFAVDLYYAALYLEKKTSKPERVIDSRQAKRIHLRFVRALTGDQLRQAYTAAVEYNTRDRLPRYKSRLEQLCAMMEDVGVGASLLFDHVPGKGIEVRINEKRKGVIEGEDFARLFFTLYFGPYPPDKNLKKGMLGRHDG
jgi:hypothetical protein